MADPLQDLIARALVAQDRTRPEAERLAARAALPALFAAAAVDPKKLRQEPLWVGTLDSLLALQPAFTEPELLTIETMLQAESRERHLALLRRLLGQATSQAPVTP
jgi:hypothetical protein